MDCSQPGSSVHGIFQARILEWVAIPFSRGSSQPRNQTWVSHISGRFFTVWATREAQIYHTAAHVSLSYAYLYIKIYMLIVGLPCPLLSQEVCSNSGPLSQWYHPTISSSVVPFSSHLQSFPAPGSFPMSQFFTSGGQSIGVSASASVLPMNIRDWFPLGLTGWISLQSKGLSRVFSNATVQSPQFFGPQPSLYSNSHIHTWLLEKP